MLSGGPRSRTLSSSKYRSVSMATATRTDHMIHTLVKLYIYTHTHTHSSYMTLIGVYEMHS